LIRIKLIFGITLSLLCFICEAQKVEDLKKSPFERAIALGDQNFISGNYGKALIAYNFALDQLYVREGKGEVEKKLNQTMQLLKAYRAMYDAFNAGNYSSALTHIKTIRSINPKDPRIARTEQQIKSIAGIPLPPPTNPSTPDERWIAKSQELIKQGKLSDAKKILLTLPKTPQVTTLVAFIRLVAM